MYQGCMYRGCVYSGYTFCLPQELKEEELDWLDYAQDEAAVKEALVSDVFSLLLDDSVSAVSAAFTKRHAATTATRQQVSGPLFLSLCTQCSNWCF